jgi:hypothetical protein
VGPLGARPPSWLSDLKLYSVYSPPEHADGAARRTTADADAAKERHQRPPRVAANQASLPAHIRQYVWMAQAGMSADMGRFGWGTGAGLQVARQWWDETVSKKASPEVR